MDRRKSLKILGLTSVSAGLLLKACKPGSEEKAAVADTDKVATTGRQDFEIEREKKLKEASFFNEHEMETITILADFIIPKDEKSGSASEAKVPEFIAFIVNDIPEHQLPMRGGLKWLDMQCLNRYDNPFKNCSPAQQVTMLDAIAYPAKASPDMQQGVAFFNRMRDLTASGFFTTKMGMEDLGYVGNRPGVWEGPPADVLAQYGLEKDL